MRVARLILLASAVLGTTGCGYNSMQRKDEAVDQAAAQIKVQLQRRADLIPNLVETVRGVAQQESTVFLGVANARARLAGALQGEDLAALAEANREVTGALGRLLALVEAYPELRSNENFTQLQDQLEGTENRVAVARQDYNAAVQDFNSYIRQFPYNLTARVFGLSQPREYFELTAEGAEQPPRVDF